MCAYFVTKRNVELPLCTILTTSVVIFPYKFSARSFRATVGDAGVGRVRLSYLPAHALRTHSTRGRTSRRCRRRIVVYHESPINRQHNFEGPLPSKLIRDEARQLRNRITGPTSFRVDRSAPVDNHLDSDIASGNEIDSRKAYVNRRVLRNNCLKIKINSKFLL